MSLIFDIILDKNFFSILKVDKEQFQSLLNTAYAEEKCEILKLFLDTMFIKLNTISYDDKNFIMNDILNRALIDDKIKIVEIILEVGINLKKFLTNKVLKQLYMSHHVSFTLKSLKSIRNKIKIKNFLV